jgi:hypothetical protein
MEGFLWSVFIVLILAAWLTHVVSCLVAQTWGFLIAGALFAPVGVIHGIGIWVGCF